MEERNYSLVHLCGNFFKQFIHEITSLISSEALPAIGGSDRGQIVGNVVEAFGLQIGRLMHVR